MFQATSDNWHMLLPHTVTTHFWFVIFRFVIWFFSLITNFAIFLLAICHDSNLPWISRNFYLVLVAQNSYHFINMNIGVDRLVESIWGLFTLSSVKLNLCMSVIVFVWVEWLLLLYFKCLPLHVCSWEKIKWHQSITLTAFNICD